MILNKRLTNFLPHFIREWLEHSTLGVDLYPLLLSSVVGLITGLATVLFIELIEIITKYATQIRDNWGIPASLGILVLAGLSTGLLIRYASHEVEGGGVPIAMETVALRRGRLRKRVAPLKILTSAITIGAGGSVGREGPVVLIGGAIGSFFGQISKISDEDVSVLVASGGAAGIAAAFNAPIAGSMFAVELILGRFTKRNIESVIIAAISANVITRSFLGESPAFVVPAYPLGNPWEIPLYILLGILCALGGVAFIKMLYFTEHRFEHWQMPIYIKAAVGMFITGLIAIFLPEVLGSGLEFIGDSIGDNVDLAVGTLVALFLLKALATTFTLGSGNSGGDLAPVLFLGAIVGSVVGQVGHNALPAIVSDPGAFALVGMAAMFAGAARAPITSIMLVLEMSNDYRLIVPLMLSVVVSTLLADILHRESIYTLKLALKGIHLERGHDVDLLQSVVVRDVMSDNYQPVSSSTTLIEMIVKLNTSHHHGFPIVDDGHLRGIVTLTDVERAQKEGASFDATVMDFGTTQNYYLVYPDDPIYLALRRMNAYGIGRLPVIKRYSDEEYLGMIRREDILKAYDIGLMRKSMETHRDERFKLRNIENQSFMELEVTRSAPMANRPLRDFPCSQYCLILSIYRHGSSIHAHGDTVIEAGDVIIAYADTENQSEVVRQFLGDEA